MSAREAGKVQVPREAAALDVRTMLYKRLDERINAMASSFQNILEVASIDDEISNSIGEYQVQVEAANLSQSCEDILSLIAEVEIARNTQDVVGSMQHMERITLPAYREITESTNQALEELITSIDGMLADLEAHYYTSQGSLPHTEPVTP